MDSEVEDNLFAEGDANLHGEMCNKLFGYICKVSEISPVLEATRPGSKPGIQPLCSLHVALEKARDLLQHCSTSSKFYLAITGNSVLLRFEKATHALHESLIRFQQILPQSIGSQIMVIANEIKEAPLTLNETEKEAGDEITELLKQSGKLNEIDEHQIFCRVGVNLGITSSMRALTEIRALKKLNNDARLEEDHQKESTASWLLHLMRKYSRSFGTELSITSISSDDMDCPNPIASSPAPTENSRVTGEVQFSEKKQVLLKNRSYSLAPTRMLRSGGSLPIPPPEFRCPLSSQVMYDPVIISSGHCYERHFIEKWIADGHETCPKTQQQLSNFSVTPNYCVKDFITSWCEQHRAPYPQPPELKKTSVSKCSDPSEINNKSDEVGVVEDRGCSEGIPECSSSQDKQCEVDKFAKMEDFLNMLVKGEGVREQQIVVEKIRFLLKDDEESRIYMGGHGFPEALLGFLKLAIEEKDKNAQEIGAMALFNLAVNNNRNKRMLLSVGVIPLLEEMISNSGDEAAAALYFNLSCLEQAKPVIGASKALPFLVQLLHADESKNQCRADALHTLYNLSTYSPNIPYLLSSGIVTALHALIATQSDESEGGPVTEGPWSEKSIAILISLAETEEGRSEIVSCQGMIGALAFVVDIGSLYEQELAVTCLLILCDGDPVCTHMVLQEGVIPALVSTSINGTAKCKDKAQKLLSLFRDRRQKEPSPAVVVSPETVRKLLPECLPPQEVAIPEMGNHRTPEKKATSKKFGKTIAAMLKTKYLVR